MDITQLTGADLRERVDHPVARLVVGDGDPAVLAEDGSWAAFHRWLPGDGEWGGSAEGPSAQACVDALFAAAPADLLDRLAWFGWRRPGRLVLPERWQVDPEHGGDWDFMSCRALRDGWLAHPRTLPEGLRLVELDDTADAAEIEAFNQIHNPHSEGKPGRGFTTVWLAARDASGALRAVGAWQTLASGTPYFAGLVVDTELRGQGIGGVLLTELTQRALSEAPEVCLGVDADNAGAIRLYERMGYVRGMAFHTDDFVVA